MVDIYRSKDFFERKEDGFLVQTPAKLEVLLPRMMAKDEAENVSSAATLVSGIGKSSLWIVGVGSFFLSFAMNNILA